MKKEKLPNLFIVGTAKAGTTSLTYYLNQHPEIFMPKLKEPRFFCYDEFIRVYYYRQPMVKNWEKYVSLFEKVKTEKVIGEASVHYLYFPSAPYKIEKVVPDAKIIILLRDPVSRAFSHYLMDLSAGFINISFEYVVFKQTNAKNLDNCYIQFIELGFYYEQVKRYLDVFGKDNVKIFLFEDLKADTLQVITSIFEFLGVDTSIKFDVNKNVNPFKTPKGIFKHIYYSIYAKYITNWYIRNFLRSLTPAL
ncbi:unnamed protein product, partial [marine sediment metagenome]